MPPEIGTDKRADGDNFQALLARLVEHPLDERAADAPVSERDGYLNVGQDERTVLSAIIEERNLALDIKLEPRPARVVLYGAFVNVSPP